MGSSKSGERSEVPSSKGVINNVEEQLPQNLTDVESSTNVKSSKRKSKNKITAESNSRGDSERNTLSSDAKKLKPQATNTPG